MANLRYSADIKHLRTYDPTGRFDVSKIHIEDGLCRLCQGIKFEHLRQGRVYEYETFYA